MPPCAIINGMQFPKKPSSFLLNELECRLLAWKTCISKINAGSKRLTIQNHWKHALTGPPMGVGKLAPGPQPKGGPRFGSNRKIKQSSLKMRYKN